jgi:hypothetical protein
MSGDIHLKRGLLRLRCVTAPELAAHAGLQLSAALRFLNEHPELVAREDRPRATSSGRSRSVWTLTEDGARAIEEEIMAMSADPCFDQECEESLRGVRASLLRIHEDVDRLDGIPVERSDEVRGGLIQAFRIAAIALDGLRDAKRDVASEIRELERLKSQFANAGSRR